jgi:sugar lactone lactonase YvrE
MDKTIAASMLMVAALGCESETDQVEQVLASGQQWVLTLRSDGEAIYWPSTAGITRLALGDTHLSTYGNQAALALAVDEDSVYWSAGNAVWAAPIAGGAPALIAEDHPCVFTLAVDATHVYWASFSRDEVWAWDKASRTRSRLATGQVNPTGLAVDGTAVYWASAGGGTVMRADKHTGEVTELATEQPWPVTVAVDETNVYWANRDGTILARALAGGEPRYVAAGEPVAGFMSVLAVDSSDVYWITVSSNGESEGYVRTIPKDGGSTRVLGRAYSNAIAVDDEAVYWSTTDGDIIARAK